MDRAQVGGGVSVCAVGGQAATGENLPTRLTDWKLPKAVGFPALVLASVPLLEKIGSEYPLLDVLILRRRVSGN